MLNLVSARRYTPSAKRLRSRVKAVVSYSRPARQAYGVVVNSLGLFQEYFGRSYDALEYYCAGRRHLHGTSWEALYDKCIERQVQASCFREGRLLPHAENRLACDFVDSDRARSWREELAREPLPDQLRLRRHRGDGDVDRQGNLMILKAPDSHSGERGVIMLKFNGAFEQFAAAFDIRRLLRSYRIVLEPSYTRNFLASLFLYVGSDVDILVQARHDDDFEFYSSLNLNIVPLRLGASDWVDTDRFAPRSTASPKEFDAVMVSAWAGFKRHHVLFQALRRLHPRRLKVALVGYPLDRTADDIRSMMREYGVAEQCTLFESLPPDDVVDVLNRSKSYVLLSAQEGTNKALTEALFCDVPAIVYRHHVGCDLKTINSQTGILADDKELAEALVWISERYRDFQPRQWALAHTGFRYATGVLSDHLRALAERRRESWTRDIAPKINCPLLRYKNASDREALTPAYDDLRPYLYS